jgi:SAM-dependent methyltransferase
MPPRLIDDVALEDSPTAANCCMNREREIRGTNSYSADLGIDAVEFLLERLQSQQTVAWLDLCCGTGRALIQAAGHFQQAAVDERVSIHGIDLVDMFAAVPSDARCLKLEAASVHDWAQARSYDLVTCVHGLHYVGDKLKLVARAASWLKANGLFISHLDLDNIKLTTAKTFAPMLGKHFKRLGLEYDRRLHVIVCRGRREVVFPFRYIGADDEAGPNFTHQEAVDSYYEPAKDAV